MKKTIHSLAIALLAISANNLSFSQLKVSSTGALSVGSATDPFTNCRFRVVGGTGGYSMFCANTSNPTSSVMIRSLNNYSTAADPDYTWWGNDQTGFFHPSSNVVGVTIGGLERARFTSTTFRVVGENSFFCANLGAQTSSPMIRGLNGYGTATAPDFTWWGNDQTGIFHPSSDVIAFTTGGVEKVRIASTAFRLTVTGSALASGGTWTNSDMRLKTNISEITGSLEKLNKINGVKYTYAKNELTLKYGLDQEAGEVFGFIAQDLEKVFPEMVKKDENGVYAVNYSMMVPVLVEALKTQNTQINDLQNRLDQLESKLSDRKLSGNTQTEAKLFQNAPNPFSEKTVIKYFIPRTATSSSIIIYDLSGHQLKKMDRLEKENGEITLNGSELGAGTYYYTLIVDNTEVDTKKLIIVQ